MAKQCAITGKSSIMAGGYSNRTRATKFNPTGINRKKANLHKKTILIPELNEEVTLLVSARGLRTITKKGALAALKDSGVISFK
ncbi:MAG TPA: bL28 family ribosomal protein [Candidatus Paceibacterota bacterium]